MDFGTSASISFIMQLIEWLIYSTWWLGDSISSLMQSVGASEKVFQLMDLSPSSQFHAKGVKLQRLIGNIEFINVSFHYPSRPTVSSAANKYCCSTWLVSVAVEKILIDGATLKELEITWWRERIGFVGQEPKLFRMDISSNIRYGCTREITQEDVEWTAKQAYAHDFISALPNGYETLVDYDLLSG